MTIRLRTNAIPHDVAKTLAELGNQAERISKQLMFRRDTYLQWSTDSLRRLGPLLAANHAERLIATPRHWILQGLDSVEAPADRIRNLVTLELSERSDALLEAARELEHDIASWGDGKAVIAVLDTNILLHHQDDLLRVNWNRKLNHRYEVPIVLAVPMKVIDELDNLKDRGMEKPRAKARLAIKLIEDTFQYGLSTELILERNVRTGGPMNSAIHMRIITDGLDHQPLPVADAEIVDRALCISALAIETWVITNDTGMRFRSVSAGLKTAKLSYQEDVLTE